MSRAWAGVLLLAFCSASAGAGEEQVPPGVSVVDTAGKPVAGARVYVEGHPFGAIPVPVKVTGPDGTARLDGGSLSATVKLDVQPPASRPDLAATTVEVWDPRAGVPVELPAGRVIDCTVVDAEGVALFAAVVWATADGRQSGCTPLYARETLRGLPRVPLRVLAIPLHAGSDWEEVLRESKAPFVDAALGNDQLTLTVWTPPTKPEVRAIGVHVRGPDGSVPARAYVLAGRGEYLTGAIAIRGEAAVWLLPSSEGPVRVVAYAARDASGQPLPWAPVVVDADGDALDVSLHMPPAVKATGRVVDEGGKPLAGARVVARAVGDRGLVPMDPLAEATTDARGMFNLVGLGAGPIQLQIQAGRLWAEGPFVEQVLPATDIVLEAPLALPARVLVVDSDQRPVAGATWVVMEFDEWDGGYQSYLVTSGRADSEGRINVPPLDPRRRLTLEIECGDARPDLGRITIKPWRPGTKTVVLPKAYTLDVRVINAEGRPVRASVYRFHERDRTNVNQMTDALGHATIRGLDPDDPLEIQAQRVEGGETLRSDRVRVTPTASRVTVTLQLPAPSKR